MTSAKQPPRSSPVQQVLPSSSLESGACRHPLTTQLDDLMSGSSPAFSLGLLHTLPQPHRRDRPHLLLVEPNALALTHQHGPSDSTVPDNPLSLAPPVPGGPPQPEAATPRFTLPCTIQVLVAWSDNVPALKLVAINVQAGTLWFDVTLSEDHSTHVPTQQGVPAKLFQIPLSARLLHGVSEPTSVLLLLMPCQPNAAQLARTFARQLQRLAASAEPDHKLLPQLSSLTSNDMPVHHAVSILLLPHHLAAELYGMWHQGLQDLLSWHDQEAQSPVSSPSFNFPRNPGTASGAAESARTGNPGLVQPGAYTPEAAAGAADCPYSAPSSVAAAAAAAADCPYSTPSSVAAAAAAGAADCPYSAPASVAAARFEPQLAPQPTALLLAKSHVWLAHFMAFAADYAAMLQVSCRELPPLLARNGIQGSTGAAQGSTDAVQLLPSHTKRRLAALVFRCLPVVDSLMAYLLAHRPHGAPLQHMPQHVHHCTRVLHGAMLQLRPSLLSDGSSERQTQAPHRRHVTHTRQLTMPPSGLGGGMGMGMGVRQGVAGHGSVGRTSTSYTPGSGTSTSPDPPGSTLQAQQSPFAGWLSPPRTRSTDSSGSVVSIPAAAQYTYVTGSGTAAQASRQMSSSIHSSGSVLSLPADVVQPVRFSGDGFADPSNTAATVGQYRRDVLSRLGSLASTSPVSGDSPGSGLRLAGSSNRSSSETMLSGQSQQLSVMPTAGITSGAGELGILPTFHLSGLPAEAAHSTDFGLTETVLGTLTEEVSSDRATSGTTQSQSHPEALLRAFGSHLAACEPYSETGSSALQHRDIPAAAAAAVASVPEDDPQQMVHASSGLQLLHSVLFGFQYQHTERLFVQHVSEQASSSIDPYTFRIIGGLVAVTYLIGWLVAAGSRQAATSWWLTSCVLLCKLVGTLSWLLPSNAAGQAVLRVRRHMFTWRSTLLAASMVLQALAWLHWALISEAPAGVYNTPKSRAGGGALSLHHVLLLTDGILAPLQLQAPFTQLWPFLLLDALASLPARCSGHAVRVASFHCVSHVGVAAILAMCGMAICDAIHRVRFMQHSQEPHEE